MGGRTEARTHICRLPGTDPGPEEVPAPWVEWRNTSGLQSYPGEPKSLGDGEGTLGGQKNEARAGGGVQEREADTLCVQQILGRCCTHAPVLC